MTPDKQVSEEMIEAGKAKAVELWCYGVTRPDLEAIYLAMRALDPDRMIGGEVVEKLNTLRRLCDCSGQGLYVEIIDEVLTALNRGSEML